MHTSSLNNSFLKKTLYRPNLSRTIVHQAQRQPHPLHLTIRQRQSYRTCRMPACRVDPGSLLFEVRRVGGVMFSLSVI